MAAPQAGPSAPHPVAAASSESWAVERQMANTLGLCETQMTSALQESDQAVDSLIRIFTSLADAMRGVSAVSAKLPPEFKASVADDLDSQLAAISRQVGSAVIAFQFYDKLTQRLGHVRFSLATLAQFVCDPAQAQQPEQWDRLHATLRSLYRTQEEREIFQLLMDDAGRASSNEAHCESPSSQSKAGDIELF